MKKQHNSRGIKNFDNWLSPSKHEVYTLAEIINIIRENMDCEIHVGTDSHLKRGDSSKHVFASVVCIQKKGRGAFYYYMQEDVSSHSMTLHDRIMEEASRSISIVEKIRMSLISRRITVHSDTNTNSMYPTKKFTDIIQKWVTSMGVNFLAKPDAWASTCVADMHSKPERRFTSPLN